MYTLYTAHKPRHFHLLARVVVCNLIDWNRSERRSFFIHKKTVMIDGLGWASLPCVSNLEFVFDAKVS